jgi:HK97 family phage prohead protease
VGFLKALAGAFGFGLEQDEPAASFAMDVPADLWNAMTAGGALAPRISRAEALQVPAVLRARNLICGTVGSLPLVTIGPDRNEVPATYLLGGNIDPEIPNSVMVAYTLEDLLFEGLAWWRVTRVGWHGYPVEARWVPTSAVHVAAGSTQLPSQMLVSPDQPIPVDGQVFIDGIPVPDREVIRFDSPNPPLLRHAARAIRTALLLDSTAGLYAESPQPLTVFTPRDAGIDAGSEEEIQAMLDRWEHARARRATGYVGAALNLATVGWSPEQLQLADARQHAVLEIARATGVDPEDLGVSTTSRTYANAETRRRDLVDFTLSAYISALQHRLSMRDVLPPDYHAKVKLDAFLRSDTKTRMETYELGLGVGAYTTEEIRVAEDRPSLPSAPGQMTAAEEARNLVEMVQKVYLGVGVVLTAEEARGLLNQAGADLPTGGLNAIAASNGKPPAVASAPMKEEPSMGTGQPAAQFDRDLPGHWFAVVDDPPWGSISQAAYTPEQWRRACLIDTGQGDADSKARYKLPVKTPGGVIHRGGAHAAASVLAGGRGGVSASAEQKAQAARALLRIYRSDLDEEPPEMLRRMAGMMSADADPAHPLLSFDDPDAYASFRVNEAKRTISGMVVPWGKIAVSGGQRWRFSENSLRWTEASRIKLNMGHDRMQTIGAAIHPVRVTSQGLDVTFRVANVPEGDRALALAASKAWDGLSIEIDFEDDSGDDWQTDPNDRSTRLVRQAKLMGVALTPMPAFDDARVAAVAASKDHTERSGNATQGRRQGEGQPGTRRRVRVRSRQFHRDAG